MAKANFFLVGAAKSGTTSVYDFLNRHPEVYMSPVKEPNYFSSDIKIDEFSETYRKTTFLDTEFYFSNEELPPLQLTFVREEKQYERLFEKVETEKVIGECSTSYLFSAKAAEEIHAYNPNAKIVMLLRNPIKRAYSHYIMALKYGFTHKDFLKALEEDKANKTKGWGSSELFIELGLYVAQIKRYFNVFKEEQIKIVFTEDLNADPNLFYSELCRFLNVEMNQFVMPSNRLNTALIPRHAKLNKVFVDFGLKNLIKQLFPNKIVQYLKKQVYSDDIPKISENEKEFLRCVYKNEINELSSLLNKNLSHWLD